MTTEVRARLTYDTHLAFKQPHQLWMKPLRRIKYIFKHHVPIMIPFQIVTRLGFVPVPPNSLS
jgi:hypothetical protein